MSANAIYKMKFNKVYPCLINKAERKGHTRAEVDEITSWLTGYSTEALEGFLHDETVTYEDFFIDAPAMNPNRSKITGSICGVKLAEITDPLMLEICYLDKLIDELAKGKAMEKILRQ